MPKDIKEYITVLRTYNPGVSDADVTSYLVGLGYNQSEIENNFLLLNSLGDSLPKEKVVVPLSESIPLIKEKVVSTSNPFVPQAGDMHPAVLVQETHIQSSVQPVSVPVSEYKKDQPLSVHDVRQVAESISAQIDKLADDHKIKIPDIAIEEQSSVVPGNSSQQNESVSQDLGTGQKTVFSSQNVAPQENNISTAPVVQQGEQVLGTVQSPVLQKTKWGKVISIVLFVLILGGLATYIYLFKQDWFRKAPLSQENFLQSVAMRISDVEGMEYKVGTSFKVVPRDPDLKDYVPSDEVKKDIDMFLKDEQKIKDVVSLLEKIQGYFMVNKKFPSSLSSIKDIKSTDLKEQDFEYKLKDEKALGFFLSFSVESEDSVSVLKKYGFGIEDKKITADESSPLQVSLGQYSVPLISFLQNQANIPGGVAMSLDLSGIYKKEQTLDTKFGIKGSYVGDDFNFDADIEAIKLSNNFYFKINKAPSLVGDVSNIKLQWVKVTQQDVLSPWFNIFSEGYKEKLKVSSYKDQVKKIIEVANELSLVSYKNEPLVKKEDGKLFYEYTLSISEDVLADFYKKVSEELVLIDSAHPLVSYDALFEKKLRSAYSKEILHYVFQNHTLILKVDAKGTPVSLDYSLRLPGAPMLQKVSDKQTVFSFGIKLNHSNPETSIEVPESAVLFKEAYFKFIGQTEEQYNITNQIISLEVLKKSLEEYKTIKGVYPEKLAQLTEKISYVKKGEGSVEKKILDVLPKDVYTMNDFVYKTDSVLGYKLVYSIILPQKVTLKKDAAFYETYITTPQKTLLTGLKYVNGQNTMTPKNYSLESLELIKKDTDKDNLSDSFEMFVGTDPKNKNLNLK